MNRTLRKIILIITFMLLFAGCVYVASAETVNSGKCGDNITWILSSEGVLTLTGTGDMYDYSVGHNNSTPAPWYRNAYDIVKAEFSEGITSIGDYAFYDCKNMKEIVIPEGLKTFGENCLKKSGISSIYIPASVRAFGEGAFWQCESLNKVIVANLESYLSIPNTYFISSNPLSNEADLYVGEDKVTELIIPTGITEISSGRFNGCTSIEKVVIPEDVTQIKESAFGNCPNLKNVDAPHLGTNFNFMCLRDEDVGMFPAGKSKCLTSSATIWWVKVPNAVKYTITQGSGNNTRVIKTITDPEETTATLSRKELGGGSVEVVKVNIYYDDGISPGLQSYSSRLIIPFKPAKTSITALSTSSKAIIAKWKSVSKIDGYQVRISSTSNFKPGTYYTYKTKYNVTSKKLTKHTKSKALKPGKKYYVKVRAYSIYDDYDANEKIIYGSWSDKKSITCK